MAPSEWNVGHQSVLHSTEEGGKGSRVLDVLRPQPGESVLDATVGLGGHASAFLRSTSPDGLLYAFDADAENLRSAEERLQPWKDRCSFFHENFRAIAEKGIPVVDIIFADLGVSSPHLDDPSRGFTFRTDAPLDLRYDRSRGVPAAAFLADATEEEITHALFSYGELRESRRIAQAMYREVRRGKGLRTTGELRLLVEHILGYRAAVVLPQVFQALRIAVNDELGALEGFLRAAPGLLRTGGRLGVISYHSLDDRMVKQAFRTLTTPSLDPTTGGITAPALFSLLTKKPIVPSAEEIARNPRARSARFRVIERNRTAA